MIHAIISLVICAVLVLTGFPWAACFIPAFFYVGREHSQAEYRYIESHGKKRANCPWYCGFLPSAWTAKGILDWVLPLAVCLAGALISWFVLGR
jgi:hypothetical protein